MTRVYERQTIRWERADIEALEEAGRAQYFPGLPGYVIDKKIPVRNHQIIEGEVAPVLSDHPHDDYLVAAAENGTSVEEYTDGEYFLGDDGHVHSSEEITKALYKDQEARTSVYIPAPDSFDEDALLAKFGV